MARARAGWLILAVALLAGGALAWHAHRPASQAGSAQAPGQADPISAGEAQSILEPDAIRAIDDPRFLSVAQAGWVPNQTPVIGVAIEGQARAYPIAMLSRHEIVNDELSGQPVAVTW